MLLIIFALTISVNALPIVKDDVEMAMDHLQKFGYMAENTTMDDGVLSETIKKYQRFMGLNVTGELDAKTMDLMNAPRCGMLDTSTESSSALSKERSNYINVSYKIVTYPIKRENIHYDDEIEAAFNIWSKYTNLRFTSTKRRQNITVEFRRGNHRDSQNFDGPGQILGHASSEVLVVHFDADESWSENATGINVYQTAVHEIGHVLGLLHSNNSESAMYAVYTGYNPKLKTDLHPEDVANIQDLYGMRPNHSTESMNQDHILNFNIIFRIDNLTYVFFQKTYIEYDENLVESARGNIDDKWKLLPANIDAAVHSRKNGKMYFFKGTEYWRYTGAYMDVRFPRSIYMGFSGINHAEAVVHFRSSLYFFYYRSFWEYKNQNITIPEKDIKSHWPGVPNFLNGAINIDNNTIYFFKKSNYYIFDASSNTTRKENICTLFKC